MGADGNDTGDKAGGARAGAEFHGERLDCRRGERLVLAGISFRLAAGQALLLTGPNGSGKSSLLRLMAGLLPPAAGRLLWNGAPVAADPEAQRGRIGFLGHRDAVKAGLTVAENLASWANLLGGAAADVAGVGADGSQAKPAIIAGALAAFGLAPLAALPARYLSAGQRRRLALARLLLARRPLWLLDEPHAGLDAASVRALEQTIRDHLARGGMAVVASHGGLDLAGAARLELAPPALAA
jgi:heme exporter protein A